MSISKSQGTTVSTSIVGTRSSPTSRGTTGPFVDEKPKADRTPVDFYILDFQDAAVVAPYAPDRWKVQTNDDRSDRARGKQFYIVNVRDCVPLLAWIDWLRG
jgi:hypothetical protein